MSELTDSQIDAIKTDVDPWLEAIEVDSDYFKIKRHIVDLQSRLAAAETDADRYRWLRDRGDDCQWQNLLRVEVDDFSSLDAAIDAARGGE